MKTFRPGLILERPGASVAIERRLAIEPDLEPARIDPDWSGLAPGIEDRDVLIVSVTLPRGRALDILGRAWRAYRYPRLVFVELIGFTPERDDDEPPVLDQASGDALVEAIRRVVRDPVYVPPRILVRSDHALARHSPAYQSYPWFSQ